MDPKVHENAERGLFRQSILPLSGLLGILAIIALRPGYPSSPAKVVARATVVAPASDPVPAAPSMPPPEPPSPPAPAQPTVVTPRLNLVEVAKAKAKLEEARKGTLQSERLLLELENTIKNLDEESSRDESLLLTLEEKAKVVAHRVGYAKAEGGRVQGARDRLQNEMTTLAKVSKPKVQALIDKSPVAKPIKGDEVHFEVRRGRVAPIELDQLVEMVKSDAKIRMKVGGVRGRPVSATVGPVGAFALKYELGLVVADAGSDALEGASIGYGLRGWEVVPLIEERGETLEQIVRPGSDYAKAVLKLTPGKTSVTFWVYPDGFELYRRLRDDLHARGYLVAARPLPEGLSIQASPSGSASAAQ